MVGLSKHVNGLLRVQLMMTWGSFNCKKILFSNHLGQHCTIELSVMMEMF